MDTVVNSTLMRNSATEAEKQHVLMSLAPVHKQKKWIWKSSFKKALAEVVKEKKEVGEGGEDEEAGPSQGPLSVLLPRLSLTLIINVFLYMHVLDLIFEEFLNIGIGDLMA